VIFNGWSLMADVRVALRGLVKKPGFALVALLTLALTIGANTTIFSLIHAILLRPFPYLEPERLVRLHTETSRQADSLREASVFDFQDWRSQSRSFEDMAAYWSFVNTLSGDGPAQSVLMTFMTPELFGVLGVRPVLGRGFTRDENQIGGPVNKVVLSFGLWQSRFGGARNVIGRAVRLRGDTFTVIGVMPPGFRFPERTDVWVPLMSRYASYPTPWWKDRNVRIHSVLGRLRAGVSLANAQAEIDTIAARLARDFATTNKDVSVRLVSLRDAEVGDVRPYLILLLGAVTLVLAIGCVNIANLLLVRAMAREGEMAIRAALGASRGQLMRQTLIESVLLSLAGGALGVGVAYGGVRVLVASIPIELPFWMTIDVNGWVLAFSAVLSLLTGLTFGLLPALQASRRDLVESLKDAGRGSVASPRRRLRQALVVAEVALSLLLFAGATLMMRSFFNLHRVDTGFDSHGLLSAYAGHFLPNRTYQEMIQVHAVDFRRVLDRLGQLPGVVSVAGSTDLPYYNRAEDRPLNPVATRGQTDAEQRANLPVANADITPGYLRTMGIPLLHGRDFTEADDWKAPLVALVSQRLADSLWPGRTAIGQMIRLGEESPENPWHRVIGVVGNTRWNAIERRDGGEVYFSYRQWPTPKLHLLVRTLGDLGPLAADLRRIVQDVNPENAITYIESMNGILDDALWQRRLWAYPLASFAGLALLLVSVGVYGVVSHTVGQRTREIGIRLALGAGPRDVLRLVVGQGLAMVMGGVILGLAASLALAPAVGRLLYGVSGTDPLTLVAVSGVLGVVAFVACSIPARRALRVDPTITLRAE
jgi:putative ABC transport system permease protein